MSWCRCTAALGVPVVPDVYSQKATSSLVVSAGSSSSDSAVTSSANPTCPGPGRPATTSCRKNLRCGRTASIAGAKSSPAMTTAARLSFRMYS